MKLTNWRIFMVEVMVANNALFACVNRQIPLSNHATMYVCASNVQKESVRRQINVQFVENKSLTL